MHGIATGTQSFIVPEEFRLSAFVGCEINRRVPLTARFQRHNIESGSRKLRQ
jgi:hypothetical protein